jgi:hypothetical protein
LDQNKTIIISVQLKKYAEFLFHHHLDDLTTESIQSARDLNLPLLKLFSSFSKEELFQYQWKCPGSHP